LRREAVQAWLESFDFVERGDDNRDAGVCDLIVEWLDGRAALSTWQKPQKEHDEREGLRSEKPCGNHGSAQRFDGSNVCSIS
jgi:hypothetical protein